MISKIIVMILLLPQLVLAQSLEASTDDHHHAPSLIFAPSPIFAPTPTSIFATSWILAPTAEPIADLTAEPIHEPTTEPIHEPTTEPIPAPAAEPIPESAAIKQSYHPKPVYVSLTTTISSIKNAVRSFRLPYSWLIQVEDIEARLARTNLQQQTTFREQDCTETASGIHDLQCIIVDDDYKLLRYQITSHDELLARHERNLYVFIYADGTYLGANYSGKLKL